MMENIIRKPCLILFILSFCLVGIVLGINLPFSYILLLASLSWLFAFRINLKGFGILLFAAAFLIRFSYILTIQTPPESDFKLLFDSAVQLSQGDYRFSQYLYFHEWAYQTGFVIYESAVVSLVGVDNALFALKVVNALWSSGTCVLVYLLSRGFVREKTARFAALLSVGAVFPVTYVTVLANQHISSFFLLLALFIIVDRKSLKLNAAIRGLLGGIALALGNIMRPEGILILSALALYFLLRLIKPEEGKRSIILLTAFLTVMIYFGITSLASHLIIQSGINEEGLRNNNPLWKLVAGLNHESSGLMTQEDSSLVYGNYYTQEQRKEAEAAIIEKRLSRSPKELFSLFIRKQKILWGGDSLFWSYNQLLNQNWTYNLFGYNITILEISQMLMGIHSLQMFILVALSVFGAFYQHKYARSPELMIFYFILLITVAIYSFIEVQHAIFTSSRLCCL